MVIKDVEGMIEGCKADAICGIVQGDDVFTYFFYA